MTDEMCSLIGGRVAEEIINGEPSTGAQNDLERLTQMAYSMVQYYGMSDKVGNLSFYDSTGARGYELTKPYSEKTAELMDKEVAEIVRDIHDKTRKLLDEHMDGFLKVAALLLEREVIFADDVEKILGPKVKPEGETPAQADEAPADESETKDE
jgi:cell division protease FtsH